MRPRVLAIDDDIAVRAAVEEALGEEFVVDTVGQGGEALEVLSRERPDVVLLDVLLPDIRGDLLAGHIQELHPTLPVVVLSVVDEPSSVVRLMRAGSVDYVPKPFDASALRAAVRQAIASASTDAPPPSCESLLGASPAMVRIRLRLAEAARDGRHVLLRAEGGFDLADVARTCARLSGPRTAFIPLGPDEPARAPAFLPPREGGVVYVPLSQESGERWIALIAGWRERCAADGKRLQAVFDASRLGPRDVDAVVQALPRVDVLTLPPLRERHEDLFPCLHFFVEKHALACGRSIGAIAVKTLEILMSYRWPGNILEMDAVAAEMVRRGAGPLIDDAAATLLGVDAFADWAERSGRFAGETLESSLRSPPAMRRGTEDTGRPAARVETGPRPSYAEDAQGRAGTNEGAFDRPSDDAQP